MLLHQWSLCIVMVTTWSLVTMDVPQTIGQNEDSTTTIDIKMPGLTTTMDDEYWCTSMQAPATTTYITSFEARPEGDRAHHMILFACKGDLPQTKSWSCYSGCVGGSNILFAWAQNAEPTVLPKDVGFEIGGAEVTYLSLQIHYRTKVPEPDYSGLSIKVTESRPRYIAGVLILAATSAETIPPHEEKHHIDLSCKFSGSTPIYPFAFRVHAHSMARVITGYQFNNSWHLLMKGNPQWPQAFYPTNKTFEIKPDDHLAARCTYNSMDKTKTTRVGMSHLDEMCNFYIMYYTDPDQGRSFYQCVGNQYRNLFSHIPEGSDVPPPPNPLLEDIAKGKTGHHHEHGYHGDEPSYEQGYTYGNGFGIQEEVGWPRGAPGLGQVAGIATDTAGNVHVFHRGSRKWDADSFGLDNIFKHQSEGPIKQDVLFTFDSTGKLIDNWGANMFFMPHGLHVDDKNNIWLTDVAMHQVMRFPKGKHEPDLVLGEKFVPGPESDHFCKPTGVATLKNGQFYVSDGYCHSRIAKFSADGKLLKEWGQSSSSIGGDGFAPPGTFSNPHSLSLLEESNILCVADRENSRVQCFDLNGKFLRQIHKPDITGKVFAVAFNPVTGALYAVNGRENYKPETTVEGFTLDPETGKRIMTWGPKTDGFRQPHDVTVAPDGKSIYVAEIGPNKIWKFTITGDEGILAVKKTGRPISVDDDTDDSSEKLLEHVEESDFGASLLIGGLLIIPIIIIVAVTIFLRLKKNDEQTYSKLAQDDLEDDEMQNFI